MQHGDRRLRAGDEAVFLPSRLTLVPRRAKALPTTAASAARFLMGGSVRCLDPAVRRVTQFRVVKTNKRGKAQNRILEMNFTDGIIKVTVA
eukprot:SAG31_NODE_3471_length_4234_cov_2.458525_4_plen_91_part_00